MSKILLIFLLIFLVCNIYSENKITKFEGGFYNVDLRFYSSGLSGVSANLANMGNTISSQTTDPAITGLNPAALAKLKQVMITADFIPPFSLSTNTFYDINGKIKAVIDKRDEFVSTPVYPEVDVKFGQLGGLKGFAASVPTKKTGNFGLAFHSPLIFGFDMIGNGSSGILTDSSENDTTRVSMALEIFSSFNADFNEVVFGYGKEINDKFSAGISLCWLSAEIAGDFTARFDGVIRRIGDQQVDASFNDPTSGFRNTLDDSIRINLKANLFSPILGVNYKYKENIMLDAALKFPSNNEFDGSLKIVQHSLGVLNENSLINPEEELLDQSLLELSKMTFTNRTIYESTLIELSYPGKIALSGSLEKRVYDLILSYEKPLGDLSVKYECDVFEDGREKIEGTFQDYARTGHKKYTYGLKLKHILKFGLSLKTLYKKAKVSFAGQVLFADQILENITDYDGNVIEPKRNIIVPTFTTGLNIPLNNKLYLDIGMLSLPGPIVRSGLTYNF